MIPELKALLIQDPHWTLAVAESLTAGHVQAMLSSVSGSSAYFLGGMTAYSLEQKSKLLGVDRRAAELVNSVSAEVARQMALGVLKLFGSDWSIATTGYAEPAVDPGVAVPFAWWAVAERRGSDVAVETGKIICPNLERIGVQTQVATAAVAELLVRVRAARARVT